MNQKEIIIRIRLNSEKDEFGNLISFKGFEDNKPIHNTIKLIGLLETIKQQEIKKLFRKELKEDKK